jgi:hypothetical protein
MDENRCARHLFVNQRKSETELEFISDSDSDNLLEHLILCKQYYIKNALFCGVAPCGSCRNDVSGERNASIIRVTRIGKLGILAVTNNSRTLRKNTQTSNLTKLYCVNFMLNVIRNTECFLFCSRVRK